MSPEVQTHIVTILSQPLAILAAFAWLGGWLIFLTWWITMRVMRFATWKGVAAAIESAMGSINKTVDSHKGDDLRMFQDMGERYQRGMEITSEKFRDGMDQASKTFTDGMELTGKYLQKVTQEQENIRSHGEKTAVDLAEIKGALRVLLPEETAKKIFKAAS